MDRRLKPIRLLAALAALIAIVVVATGCGTSDPDTDRGRTLFVQKCGTCHAMAEAGTSAQVGPNLDDAFAAAREIGHDSDTIEGIVKVQVEHPRPPSGNPAADMPADIVTGQDLDDVAAYVGQWAGVPGAAPPEVPGGPGAQVFADQGCGGCHTLAEANAGGTTGPNLDEVLPGVSQDELKEMIVDPNAEIAQGYPPNVMPDNYEQTLSKEELEDLIEFLAESTSGKKSGGA
jgi:mono/diheme cytochrome c family protein